MSVAHTVASVSVCCVVARRHPHSPLPTTLFPYTTPSRATSRGPRSKVAPGRESKKASSPARRRRPLSRNTRGAEKNPVVEEEEVEGRNAGEAENPKDEGGNGNDAAATHRQSEKREFIGGGRKRKKEGVESEVRKAANAEPTAEGDPTAETRPKAGGGGGYIVVTKRPKNRRNEPYTIGGGGGGTRG